MGNLDIDISEVKKLVELVEAHSLEEITVEEGDLSITVKGRSAAPVVVQAATHMPVEHAAQPVEDTLEEVSVIEEQAEFEGNIVDITAPLVGVFFRAPTPDSAPFVEVGDIIEVGTEVGLIEAMKVFSPIPSEVPGEVIAIPAENGKLVQQGDILVRIRLHEE